MILAYNWAESWFVFRARYGDKIRIEDIWRSIQQLEVSWVKNRLKELRARDGLNQSELANEGFQSIGLLEAFCITHHHRPGFKGLWRMSFSLVERNNYEATTERSPRYPFFGEMSESS